MPAFPLQTREPRRSGAARRLCAAAALFCALLAGPVQAQHTPLPPGWHEDQPLPAPSPWVNGEDFAARLLSPLHGRDVSRFLAAEGKRLAGEPFAPGAFRVDLRVPARQPEAGYGLLVFVPPADDLPLPSDWGRVLDREGILLVVPRGADNEADVFGRRIPAVLHAQHHAVQTFRIDPARTFVGGFSGGARLAQRVALAWPDVFRGSLQFAGSVVVGENLLPPPPRQWLDLARERSRFVLVSGTLDGPNRRNDAEADARLQALCFSGVHRFGPPRLDHWMPDARGLAKALAQLQAPADPEAMRRCREDLDAEVERGLAAVEAQLAAGDVTGARDALVALDDRYGGLAAPRSLALAARIQGGQAPAGD